VSLERRHFKRTQAPVPAVLSFSNSHISCITKNISKKGLCLEIPIQTLSANIFEMLNKNVTLDIQKLTVEGSVKWYTVSNALYLIGILVDNKYRDSWKSLADSLIASEPKNMVLELFQFLI